ncbi:acetate--CoA ligase family protein [Roseovarius aestuarii]|nr:acetate--CoA ligase family protein [Roseovarius aestuarii]
MMVSKTRQGINALCDPRHIALIGASPKAGSAGSAMVQSAQASGFHGSIYHVNPVYEQINGAPCYGAVSDLPQRPDLAVICLANERLEAALEDCIAAKIPAAVIFASAIDGTNDVGEAGTDSPRLVARLKARAQAAGMVLCGPNCMGLMRPSIGLNVAAFTTTHTTPAGGVVWLAQSGSAFAALAYNQPRMGFALAVSSGSESVTTLSDYMSWALERSETRVIGLFLEGVRDAPGFVKALERAAARNIPVVVLKVGRTAKSAQMAESHTGALAGNDGAYQALFRKYGVIQVDDLDEMAATLALFDTGRQAGDGGLATMHDSGGERELLVDLAETTRTPWAEISQETKAAIAAHLDPGLVAENPLDAWGTAREYEARYTACGRALLADPGTALLGFFSDPRDGHGYHAGLVRAVVDMATGQDKPVFIASNTLLTEDMDLVRVARAAGVPLIKGTRAALTAARAVIQYRAGPIAPLAAVSGAQVAPTLPAGAMGEAAGLDLMRTHGIDAAKTVSIDAPDQIAQACHSLRLPVVLKTAAGHAHKSDVGGVVLNLATEQAVIDAYAEMAARLGPQATLMEMAPAGVELALGAFVDPGFGPVIAVSAGGVLIEVFRDVAFALPPLSPEGASALLGDLKIARLLEGHRGARPADIATLCQTISQFSQLVWALRDQITEIDVNPMIVTPDRVVAVDALIIAKTAETPDGS